MRRRIEHFQSGIVTSVTAFLAWKAFLITARSIGARSERDRCVERLLQAQQQQRECRVYAARFAEALEALSEQSNVAIAEWLAADDDDEDTRDGKVARFKREIARLTSRDDAELTVADQHTIAEYAVYLRHSVIAHGSVHSTGNLFEFVVPKFEDFIASVACQGYASNGGLSFQEAAHECAIEHG